MILPLQFLLACPLPASFLSSIYRVAYLPTHILYNNNNHSFAAQYFLFANQKDKL